MEAHPPTEPTRPADGTGAESGGGGRPLTGAAASSGEVLIAEDSELQAVVLRKFLESNGLRVITASNGREALAYLETHRVSLVISDVNMPEFNGYDLSLAIKTHPQWQHIPVILLTSLTDTDSILEGLKARADYYLTKPYSRPFLLSHVRKLMDRPSAGEAEERLAPLEIELNNKQHQVPASRAQMLSLLLSTYECASQQNRELIKTQRELGQRNGQLQEQTLRLQASERNFRNLLDHNVDGMMVVDQQGSVRYCNLAAQALLGKGEGELLNQPFSYSLPSGQSAEAQIDRPPQAPIIAELRVVETLWEREPALLVSLRDITRRKQAEAKVREQQSKLEEANLRLQALATTDGLTGLKNHRTFKERLAEEFERSRRFHQPLALALIDVDHFKSFNDTFGHPAGDEVLRALARLLLANSRQTDFVARHGGEEFAVLLPNTGPTEAIFAAERLRQAIERHAWDLRAITISLGVSFWSQAVGAASDMILAADQALYRSKEQGRNQLTAADQDAATTKPS